MPLLRGLTAKLLFLVFIVGSVPMSILGGFTFFMTKANMEDMLYSQLQAAADDASRQVESLLRDTIEAADWMASQPSFSQSQLENWASQHPLLRQVSQTQPGQSNAQIWIHAESANTWLQIERQYLEQRSHLDTLGEQGRINVFNAAPGASDGYVTATVERRLNPGSSALYIRAELPEDALYAPVHRLNIVMWSLWIIAFITAMFIGYAFAGRLLTPLRSLRDRLRNIASQDADLTQQIEITTNDEIGQIGTAFNQFMRNLQTVVSKLADTADSLAEQAAVSQRISERSREALNHQHSQVDQVATAVNEMAATVQEVAINTQDAANSAEEANQASAHGANVVQQTMVSIGQLADDVERAATVIGELNTETSNISGILDSIRGIADQTNLLALNAAIEAARAGEQGRGFAVVADEVRTLAIRVSEATDDIHHLLKRLQNSADDAVEVMHQGRRQAAQSMDDANQTDSALQRIHSAMAKISEMNLQIATATEEQSAVAEEINRNIVTISELAYETANQADDAATASNELSQLALSLQHIVHRFRY